ncbi:hypothetical protein VZT92_012605 [Zoarces viviparus]
MICPLRVAVTKAQLPPLAKGENNNKESSRGLTQDVWSPRTTNQLSSPPRPPHNVTPRHPVDGEVSRLFGPYIGGRRTTRRRTVAAPAQLHSYTHSFCCIEDKNADLVPNRYAQDRLAAAGLGETSYIPRRVEAQRGRTTEPSSWSKKRSKEVLQPPLGLQGRVRGKLKE